MKLRKIEANVAHLFSARVRRHRNNPVVIRNQQIAVIDAGKSQGNNHFVGCNIVEERDLEIFPIVQPDTKVDLWLATVRQCGSESSRQAPTDSRIRQIDTEAGTADRLARTNSRGSRAARPRLFDCVRTNKERKGNGSGTRLSIDEPT